MNLKRIPNHPPLKPVLNAPNLKKILAKFTRTQSLFYTIVKLHKAIDRMKDCRISHIVLNYCAIFDLAVSLFRVVRKLQTHQSWCGCDVAELITSRLSPIRVLSLISFRVNINVSVVFQNSRGSSTIRKR